MCVPCFLFFDRISSDVGHSLFIYLFIVFLILAFELAMRRPRQAFLSQPILLLMNLQVSY